MENDTLLYLLLEIEEQITDYDAASHLSEWAPIWYKTLKNTARAAIETRKEELDGQENKE